MGGAISTYREEDKALQGSGGKTRRKETHGKIQRRWNDNNGIDITEIGRQGADWVETWAEGANTRQENFDFDV